MGDVLCDVPVDLGGRSRETSLRRTGDASAPAALIQSMDADVVWR